MPSSRPCGPLRAGNDEQDIFLESRSRHRSRPIMDAVREDLKTHKQGTTAKRWRTQCHVNPFWLDPRAFSALNVFAVPSDGRPVFAHAPPPLPWTLLAFVGAP